MWSRGFWIGTADRAIKAFATTLLLLLGGGQTGLNLLAVNWRAALATAGGAALLSVLTSLVSAPIGEPGTTSALRGGR